MPRLTDEQALREADRCVKCGLCLAHCPTYRLQANENESPRGRIALAEALLRGQLGNEPQLLDHLYRCLLCRRCERTCPSGVRYAALMDAARAHAPRPHWTTRLARQAQAGDLLGRLAQRVPLPGSTLSALARALPPGAAPAPGRYPASGAPHGEVGLFLGCVSRQYQGRALQAALRVLTRLGYRVLVPAGQARCGALAQHQGDSDTAARQIEANHEAFRGKGTVLGIASGCSAQLGESLGGRLPVADIVSFVRRALDAQAPALRPLPARAALHLPCSAENTLRNGDDHRALLRAIPGLQVRPLGGAGDCCGAAGDQLLTQRAQAEALRRPLLEQLREQAPDYLLSSNIGCALHLAEGAKKAGVQLEVLHPVELLARQLPD